jgi:hypothetical protein
MVDSPYSGAATRAAYFRWKPPVPGVNADHTTPDPEPDLFNPVPDPTPVRTETAYTGAEPAPGQSGQPNLAQVPVSHVYNAPPPAPFGLPYGDAQQRMQDRLMWVHGQSNYVPDGIRLYQHATEGQVNEWQIGRMPQAAGQEIAGGPLAGLGDGKNSYDQTNGMRPEIYTGDAPNVGRYRLGVKTNIFGLYENPIGKFGQDAMLHAYTGLYPALPDAKPPMENTAPYTPNSTGTAHWAPAVAWQRPRLFNLPSETAITDFGVANSGEFVSDFTDRTDGFY